MATFLSATPCRISTSSKEMAPMVIDHSALEKKSLADFAGKKKKVSTLMSHPSTQVCSMQTRHSNPNLIGYGRHCRLDGLCLDLPLLKVNGALLKEARQCHHALQTATIPSEACDLDQQMALCALSWSQMRITGYYVEYLDNINSLNQITTRYQSKSRQCAWINEKKRGLRPLFHYIKSDEVHCNRRTRQRKRMPLRKLRTLCALVTQLLPPCAKDSFSTPVAFDTAIIFRG